MKVKHLKAIAKIELDKFDTIFTEEHYTDTFKNYIIDTVYGKDDEKEIHWYFTNFSVAYIEDCLYNYYGGGIA